MVTRRNQHLRMDVLVGLMPRSVQMVLRLVEQLLLATLAVLMLTQFFLREADDTDWALK